jgi:hypothetical protein
VVVGPLTVGGPERPVLEVETPAKIVAARRFSVARSLIWKAHFFVENLAAEYRGSWDETRDSALLRLRFALRRRDAPRMQRTMPHDAASPPRRSKRPLTYYQNVCDPLISLDVSPRTRCYSWAVPHISERNSEELSDDAYDEDTLELEPISEQNLSSLRAAEEDRVTAIASEPQRSSPPPVLAPTPNAAQTRRSGPVHSRLLMSVAGILALSVAIAKWATNHHARDVDFAVPTAAPTVPVSSFAADMATKAAPSAIDATETITPPGPTVKFRNPFDASEVFEFPPGTTQMEARHAVRETLLQRARESTRRHGRRHQ